MNFYKIKLNSLPEIVFAHSFKTSDYKRVSSTMKNFFEVSYCIDGRINLTSQYGKRTVYANTVCCDLYNYPYTSVIDSPHQHCTVGMKITYEFETIDKNEVLQHWRNSFTSKTATSDVVLVPEFIEDNKFSEKVRDKINNIIRLFDLGTNASLLSATSQVFSLFSILTEAAVSIASGDVSYSDTAYCAKATAFIAKNAHRQITVYEIANELDISVGHLSRIFHSVTGDSLISYVNKTKVERAKRLILSGLRTGEIAEMLGMADEKYFCRIFKKYTGVTVGQYRRAEQ